MTNGPRRAGASTLLVVGVLLTAPQLLAQRQRFDLLTASVTEIQSAVAAGALSYERLITLYLARIAAYDKSGPKLNAVLQINPRAIDEARALDLERRATGLRGPLHGIPVAVKDNIDVHDLPSAGGTAALAGSFPPRDATVVTKLRQSGAIIFLKTNMDELALGSQGLSSLGGQMLNPYDLRHDPGGSSGGTAVAVNVGFAAIGLATKTGVSIRGPASNNALVGIAPSRGLVSRAGVIPISFTQDRVGVHAKSVADAAALLHVARSVHAGARRDRPATSGWLNSSGHRSRSALDGLPIRWPAADACRSSLRFLSTAQRQQPENEVASAAPVKSRSMARTACTKVPRRELCALEERG